MVLLSLHKRYFRLKTGDLQHFILVLGNQHDLVSMPKIEMLNLQYLYLKSNVKITAGTDRSINFGVLL